MNNLFICIGQCGANIVKDISDTSKLSEWQIIYYDKMSLNLKEQLDSNYINIYIFCGLGGKMSNDHISEILKVCRPLTINILCFCTLPFAIEGDNRSARAKETLAIMREVADIVVVQSNDKLPGAYTLSQINDPIVKAALASISQSHKPLFYALSAIIDTTNIDTGLKPYISTDIIDIVVNENRLKNIVSEALGVDKMISSPDGVRNTMQEIWSDYKNRKQGYSKIYEVLLPTGKLKTE